MWHCHPGRWVKSCLCSFQVFEKKHTRVTRQNTILQKPCRYDGSTEYHLSSQNRPYLRYKSRLELNRAKKKKNYWQNSARNTSSFRKFSPPCSKRDWYLLPPSRPFRISHSRREPITTLCNIYPVSHRDHG